MFTGRVPEFQITKSLNITLIPLEEVSWRELKGFSLNLTKKKT